MNGLKVFTNEEFGDVAVISIDNKPYFEGIKVARILGYKNPNDAIKRHCKYLYRVSRYQGTNWKKKGWNREFSNCSKGFYK